MAVHTGMTIRNIPFNHYMYVWLSESGKLVSGQVKGCIKAQQLLFYKEHLFTSGKIKCSTYSINTANHVHFIMLLNK